MANKAVKGRRSKTTIQDGTSFSDLGTTSHNELAAGGEMKRNTRRGRTQASKTTDSTAAHSESVEKNSNDKPENSSTVNVEVDNSTEKQTNQCEKEDDLTAVISDWSVQQLKALHDYINKRGTDANALAYGAARIPGRSATEIDQMVKLVRERIDNQWQDHRVAQERVWLHDNSSIQPLSSPSSEVTSWSQALQQIQSRKRKIHDCTKQALSNFLWHEVSCRPASKTVRRLLPVTDSDKHPGSSVKEVVDFARIYRFLHSCVTNGSSTGELKSLEAAVLLNIINEIQKEVDSEKYENERRILAGIFRKIQDGDLSGYEFHPSKQLDDIQSVQLDPLNILERIPNLSNGLSFVSSERGEQEE